MRNQDELDEQERRAVQMAMGRIFRIMSRPYQDGDHQQFDYCRRLIEEIVGEAGEVYSHSGARCRPGWNFGSATEGRIE